jgi:peptidyl-dipeptidase Dcp
MTKKILLAATALVAILPVSANAQSAKANAKATGAAKTTPTKAKATMRADNPFAKPSTLPFEAPPFDKIKDTDYEPAILAGMAQQRAEIRAIDNDSAAPTFANTIVLLEKSGRLLERASNAFYAVTGANTNDTLQAAESALAPKFAAHADAINLDPKLFARVSALYSKRDTLKLDPEQAMVLQLTYENMVRAGAKLTPADKATLSKLNAELSTLENDFSQRLLAGTKAGALVVDDKAKLAGMTDAEIAAAADAAKERGLAGKYVLSLQNTTQQPPLAELKDRRTRQALFDASWTRSEKGDANDTRAAISQIALLRAQKAKLLGFDTWADYVLENQMAKTPEIALGFMQQLGKPIAVEQRREAAELTQLIKQQGGDFSVTPADWDFYSEQLRKAKYDLNQDELKPYFEINKVLTDGVFYAANQLYGLTFKKRTDLPVWQPDVVTYDVYDADGSQLGIMYFDFWKRDNKSGGAWMSNLVNQSKLLGTKPVIYNVANFTKPAAGQPALITFDDVTTMFHEFGHALHGLFANQTYPSVSGTNTARDFVEFPSQFNEHWALDPKVLPHYAVNYKTGEVIPQSLIDKIKRASTFNIGYSFGETLTAAELDMSWHSLTAADGKQDVDAYEKKALAETGLDTTDVPPRYRTSYFRHIWANGYSAGYYAYIWTKMLDENAYNWFEDHGGMTRANGQRFREMILSKGHTEDYAPMFRAFYGADPSPAPLLKSLGLNADGSRISDGGAPASDDGTVAPNAPAAVTPGK